MSIDAKPGSQSGDTDLIAFLRSMGVQESEAERIPFNTN
jgi:hypothetical protein